MATTWIKPLHKGGGIASALGRSIDYIGDADKTADGELLYGFECNPRTAQAEFMLSKRLYTQQTGRDQGKHNVIAYHVRMSFKSGEVGAENALELGKELASRWTKNKHQFVVAAHVNTSNPHVHIIYNSVNLENSGKYQDFKGSSFALRRVADQICLERGLSVIENPGMSKGHNRSGYMGVAKPPTVREQLQNIFDEVIPKCVNYDNFIDALKACGVSIKFGKQHSYKLPDAKRFVRQDTLGDDYSLTAVIERMAGKRKAPQRQNQIPAPTIPKPNLLIDIQAKLQEGKGAAYEQWATIFNIKQLSRTLIFLKDNGIDSYDDLVKKSDVVSSEYDARLTKIKEVEARLKEISELQRHIGVYGKTKDTYKQYLLQPAKKREDFFEANRADIMLHKAAKKYFDGLGLKKLPKISELKQEYAKLSVEKKKLYAGYYELQDNHRALLTAKSNARRVLGLDGNSPERDISRSRSRDISYER